MTVAARPNTTSVGTQTILDSSGYSIGTSVVFVNAFIANYKQFLMVKTTQ